MSSQVRLLIVEDNPGDAELLIRSLRRSGLSAETIVSDDLEEIRGLIDSGSLSAVLTDHQLSAFTASDVLTEVTRRKIDLPVIVVSGAVGEDMAASLMREGAANFVRKDNLARLLPTLSRELREVQARKGIQLANQQRLRSESLLRFVIQMSGDIYWEWNITRGVVTWSETFQTLCGPELPAVPSMADLYQRIHESEAGLARTGIEAVQTGAKNHWSGNFRVRRGDGTWVLMLCRCFVVRDRDQDTRLIGLLADITERQSMIERQSLFTALVDQASESIAVIDPEDGRFLEFNSTAHQALGYTAEEFASKSVYDIDCQYSRAQIDQFLIDLRTTEMREVSARHRAKDGGIREVRIHSRPIQIQETTYLAAVWQDITDRLAIEAELRQAQKMDILGQIAGGIAHDFNNILSVMRLQLDLARMVPGGPEQAQELVTNLSGMVDRASSLTRRLLGMSRKESAKLEDFSLDESLDDLISITRRILGAGIEIRRIRPPGPLTRLVVNADRSIMDQVFMNLFVNARDAMPKGGVLTVETSFAEAGVRPGGGNSGSTSRPFIRIRITDTGVGMSAETLAKIQEPFFTTKGPGRGTGLGLSTARRCLNEHGGWMAVESEEGRGTTFTIHLPLAASASVPTESGPAKVLLVIGDSQLRLLARKVIEKLGCRVLPCANTAEAIRILETPTEGLDLAVIPDQPEAPGSEAGLARRLKDRFPGLPMILTRSTEAVSGPLPPGQVRVLDMPFSIPDLTAAISESLPGRVVEPRK